MQIVSAFRTALLRPTQRLRNWAGGSVLNRLTAISMGTSVLLLVAVALIAFPLFYGQARSTNAARYGNNLERANELVRFRVSALYESLSQLAANSFVVNAVVDSTGRELYLIPTLRDYRAPFGAAHTLTLLDSNLTVFGDTRIRPRFDATEKQIARLALERGKSRLIFNDVQGQPQLLIAIPIYYPPASAHEGVLLSRVDTHGLMQPALDVLGPQECLTISHGEQILLSTPCDATQTPGRMSMQSTISRVAEGDVTLTITFGDTSSSPFSLLSLIGGMYAMLSLLALLMVFAATRYIGRSFAGKLEELAHAAHRLAADPNSTARAQWDHPDEIGRLTVAFDTLVEKWREIQASLEQRVVQRTEQLAGALEQARQSSRAKSEFLAVMSHEIRTPMNGVVGMIQALETTELNPEQRRLLEVIRGSSDLLLSIIGDLLDFSKIEAGKLTLDCAPLRFDLLAQDLVAAHMPAATARGVDLLLQPLSPELSAAVSGDATRLRQAIANLVHNAIKFTNPGGHVQVTVMVQPQGDARQFTVEVSDTGVGIDAAQQERIFEPFEQADRTTTRRFGGTGLGLAIVKRLVEMMDGSIEVDSEPGRGSRFRITLALKVAVPGPALEEPASGDDRSVFKTLRVLVVEDNPTNQIVATALLDTLGIDRVTVVENGREAVNAALQGRFDLILMDIYMPLMDGCEATRVLRSSGVATPIVAMTANVRPEDCAAYLDAGMLDTLAKPMDRGRLRQVIERYCQVGPNRKARIEAD